MPISIDVKGKRILLIGGGNVAVHKLQTLVHYDANIHVVAKEVSEAVKAYPVTWDIKDYHANILQGAWIVYACTNNRALNAQIREDCTRQNILVNVVDDPAQCDFVSPAIYKTDNLSIAVTSNGEDVKSSIAMRDKIKQHLEHGNAPEIR